MVVYNVNGLIRVTSPTVTGDPAAVVSVCSCPNISDDTLTHKTLHHIDTARSKSLTFK